QDRAKLVARDNSTVTAMDHAQISLGEHASATAFDRVKVDAWGSSRVIAKNDARVIANGSTTVDLFDRAKANATTPATVNRRHATTGARSGGDARIYIPTLRFDSSSPHEADRKLPGTTATEKQASYAEDTAAYATYARNRDAVVKIQVTSIRESDGMLMAG